MSPVLGIIASSTQQGRGGGPVGAYDALATVTVPSGGLASITFAGIPAGYEHLQIRALARSTRAATSSNIYLGFNGDTTTGNYYGHMIQGDGSSATANAKIGSTTSFMSAVSAASNTSGIFSAVVIDVLDYANTTKNKTSRALSGYDANGSGSVFFASGLWINTAAITSIELTDALGNFAENSIYALYGVK
jgi:hypothetical protein